MHVVITGANRGVGRALADHFRARGDRVTGTARDGSGDILLDVTDPASLAACAGALHGQAVDLLVCNAGILIDRHETIGDGYAPDLWAKTFAVNVTGVFLTVQALLPSLRAADAAKVAIISSQMGSSQRASGSSLIYRASKAAATNLGCNLATLLQGDGIAVGSYHPGWVRTDRGGADAPVTPRDSAQGLRRVIAGATRDRSGSFTNYDGRPLPW